MVTADLFQQRQIECLTHAPIPVVARPGTSSLTGSLTIAAPGHSVTDVDAPKVTVRLERALIAAPLSRRPICVEPTTTAFVPKVFDSEDAVRSNQFPITRWSSCAERLAPG
jgi:hypothetical protein